MEYKKRIPQPILLLRYKLVINYLFKYLFIFYNSLVIVMWRIVYSTNTPHYTIVYDDYVKFIAAYQKHIVEYQKRIH